MLRKLLTFSLLCLFALASVAYAEDPATPTPEALATVSEAAAANEETPEAAESAVAATPAEEPPCQALPSAGKVLDGWDPATCGSCGSFCSSDNACMGKLLGDPCGNNNQTCLARTGCALFNCCTCG